MTSLFERIADADRGIRPLVPQTTLDRSAMLSQRLGCEVWLKADHLMPTGSFKVRGAVNKIRLLGDAARRSGVITASTGNHGLAVAWAGKTAGVAVTVMLAAATAREKQQAIAELGARLVIVEGNPLAAELEARRVAERQDKPYISPYNDLDIVAGQGTLGLELFRQAPDLDAVFLCVGGGGLIGGVGTALKELKQQTRIIGVWPKASTCMRDSLEAGRIVATPEGDTLSDSSTGAIEPGAVTFPICQQVIDETLTVGEDDIARAMRLVAAGDHWIVEGAAGVAVAGLIQSGGAYRGGKIAAVLCGRNIALETFCAAITRGKN